LAFIASLAVHRRPKSIFEFGTFDGRTTLNLHANCPDAAMHTIDLPPNVHQLADDKTAGSLIRELVANGKIRQLYGDSTKFDFSQFFGKHDFVFIDAGHAYANVISDSRNALRLVEGNEGAIVWHDYAHLPDVTQAVEDIRGEISSDVAFTWLEGTSLAIMQTAPRAPLRLKESAAR
jgi:predicted O-methyltransferase YrrM